LARRETSNRRTGQFAPANSQTVSDAFATGLSQRVAKALSGGLRGQPKWENIAGRAGQFLPGNGNKLPCN
jgi:hypothetical protein